MELFGVLESAAGILLVFFALASVFSKKLITSIIYMSVLSMTAVTAFALMRAPDVAVTEAVIGSGLITFIFLVSLREAKKEGEAI